MDQSRAPVIEAYRERRHVSFLPPGHKQGRGVDPRVLAAHTRAELAKVPGLRVLDRDDLDPLKIVIDLRELAAPTTRPASGCARTSASTWASPTITAQLTVADDELPEAKPIDLPAPGELELEQAALPRDAFGSAESVPAAAAVGRMAAETVSPYPPGVPVITSAVVEYLRSGLAAGMFTRTPRTIRVVT